MRDGERHVYEESLKDYRDLKSSMDTYFAEGREKGLAEGMEKGIEKGEERRNTEIVISSFKQNIPIETIAVITQLSADRIEEILRQQRLID